MPFRMTNLSFVFYFLKYSESSKCKTDDLKELHTMLMSNKLIIKHMIEPRAVDKFIIWL